MTERLLSEIRLIAKKKNNNNLSSDLEKKQINRFEWQKKIKKIFQQIVL